MGTVFVMPLSKGAAFDRLAEEVAREYEAKGYSREHALEIGRAVAGKIARKKCKAGRRRRRKSLAPMLILPLAKGGWPGMPRYKAIKAKYPNVILLFRRGSHWMAFGSDGKLVKQVYGARIVPQKDVDRVIDTLQNQGHQVALCGLIASKPLAKGLEKPVNVRQRTNTDLAVSSPYNANFIKDVKRLRGAKWDVENRVWVVPAEHKEKLFKLLATHYKWNPEDHPRVPAGVPEGGQFAEKGTTIFRPPYSDAFTAWMHKEKMGYWDASAKGWRVAKEDADTVRAKIEEMFPQVQRQGVKYVSVSMPSYNERAIAEIKQIPGRQYDPTSRTWSVPETEADKAKAIVEKYFSPKATGTPTSQGLPEGHKYIRRGEGYGGYPFRVGETIKDDGKYWTVVSASKQYFREDGMSFGVGDESGYVYTAEVRPATEEEAAPLKEREEQKRRYVELKEELSSIFKKIFDGGKDATPKVQPEGEDIDMIGNPRNIYGGGRWFVIGKNRLWAIENNGADGDDWSRNNVRTGGAGAIGRYIPYTAKMAKRIREATTEAKALKAKFAGD